jgi:cytochrome c5
MRRLLCTLAATLLLAPGLAVAQDAKAAKAVYEASCAACHGAGILGAPKFGDAAQWAPRAKAGIDALLKNAIAGTTKGMPPKGGRADLPLEEFARAAAFMARAAGGDWKDPDVRMLQAIRSEEKKRIADMQKKK